MNNPLVSICCITYNHVNFIKECLEGFLIQKTDFPVEILIYDDASTDGTTEIIKEYASKYTNIITFLQKENQWSKNKYGLMEYLLPAARGKYIAFCEGDDYWLDGLKLQKQFEFMENNNEYAACCSNVLLVDTNSNLFSKKIQVIKNEQSYSFEDIIKRNYRIIPATLFIKKSSLVEAKVFDNPNLTSDLALILNITKDGAKIFLMNRLFACYRVHNNNITKNNKFMLALKLKSISDFKNSKGYKTAIYKFYLNYYIHEMLKLIPIKHPFKRK